MFSAGDIADLEKKYSRYVFKKNLKIMLFIITVIIIVSSIFYYFIIYFPTKKVNIKENNKTEKREISKKIIAKNNPKVKQIVKLSNLNTSTQISEKNTTRKDLMIAEDKNITQNIVLENKINKKSNLNMKKTKEKKQNQIIFHIEPSNDLSFENSPRQLLSLHVENTRKLKKDIKPIKTISKNIDKNDTIKEEKVTAPKIKIEMHDIDSVRYLKNKYDKTHNIIFALMLCEEYYSQKDYINSLKWSIIANDIDNQSERSWIWFAKSKFKLGKKNDAVKALKAFLRSNQSNTVKLLLESIENGSLND